MASDSSKEQLATVQMDALNTVCLQFADPDKKTLKRKVVELSNDLRSESKHNSKVKFGVHNNCMLHIENVMTVLKEGKQTGLTLSPEEVQRLYNTLDDAVLELDELVREW